MQKRTAILADDDLRRAERIARRILTGQPIIDLERRALFAAIYAARHVLRTEATTKRARNDAWYVGQDKAQNIMCGKSEDAPHIVS